MAIDFYVPACVTKGIVVIIAIHIIVGLLSPPTLASLLDRYLMILRLMTDFFVGVTKEFLRTILGL